MEFYGQVLGQEEQMAGASLLVKIRADEKCISIPGARVILCPKGLFTPDHRLPRGTAVVVQLCDGQHELTLFGTVRTSNMDSELAIEFMEATESVAQGLAALLVA
jgi:hypothetical protein